MIKCRCCKFYIDKQCHRNVPQAVTTNFGNANYEIVWLSVNENDTCGEGIDPNGSIGYEVGCLSENFQTGWYLDAPFNMCFFDDFESIEDYSTLLCFEEIFDLNWYTNNNFGSLFIEIYESNWFVDGIFNQRFLEDFQGVW